jgi:hypothetical protein
MAGTDKVTVVETTKEYELTVEDIVQQRAGDDEPTWYNKTSGIIYAFYSSTTWFMALADPTNSQAAFISTIVGAGAAFFGLYVGKPGAALPKSK